MLEPSETSWDLITTNSWWRNQTPHPMIPQQSRYGVLIYIVNESLCYIINKHRCLTVCIAHCILPSAIFYFMLLIIKENAFSPSTEIKTGISCNTCIINPTTHFLIPSFSSLHSFLPAYMYMTREAWVTWRNTWFSISLLYLNGDGKFVDRYRKGYYVVPIFMANQNLFEKIYLIPRLDLYSLRC